MADPTFRDFTFKNHFGMDAQGDTVRPAPAFLGVTNGTQKGQLICLQDWAEAERLTQ